MLRFFGRGSAFADAHNAAFFTYGDDLILLDSPASAFPQIKRLLERQFAHIYVLVTHTHGDHTGGLGTLLQYCYFKLQNPLTVLAPSAAVAEDLGLLLYRIEGCGKEWFHMQLAADFSAPWLHSVILTEHVLPLAGKCFGYALRFGGRLAVYTGDTRSLDRFLPLLRAGDTLYTECATIDSGVHVYLPKVLPELAACTERGIKVYLMHMDDEKAVSALIAGTELALAPLADEVD